jgi:hypothetical protein
VLEPKLDLDVVAFQPLPALDGAVKAHRPLREPDPEPRQERREQEPERDRVERFRTECARDDVGQQTEAEQRAAPTGQWSSQCRCRVSGV